MEQWLLSEEPSKRKWSKPRRSTKKKLSLRTIFRAFKGSVTQRGFLRQMQQKHNAVVAGSYATALYLSRTHGSVTWNPHDIDLWVACSHDECKPCEKMVTKCAKAVEKFKAEVDNSKLQLAAKLAGAASKMAAMSRGGTSRAGPTRCCGG